MEKYDPKSIEKKWQSYWEENKTFSTPMDATPENKYYILPQLPYPSGSGLHVGHAEVYTACDIYARYQRMKGKKVLQVFGLDSFGLPAENYAIKTNVHPKETIDQTGANFVEQVKKLGASVDWDRFVRSSDPEYYKFTQWFFLLMYERGLAYRKTQAVNWCDSCKTVLANAQVVDGQCERCDTVVVQKDMEQWYLKITDYAEQLLEGLDRIDWPEETKKRQKDWIGKSEGAEITFSVRHSERPEGVEESRGKQRDLSTSQSSARDDVSITVFTTRPDTLFGATYMVLAPEGEYVQSLKSEVQNWDEVESYITETSKKTELERQTQKEKTGVELKGVKAVNPANGEEIPIWIADYVIATYGTGAIMAVPAHDERDFEFAKKYKLPIKQVVESIKYYVS
ncbi:MAG: leucine--tRNA ligase, partial [Candidatus Magasanikbacteria bacterium CG_4_10_14_0_2_um_filter_41_10]